MGQKASRLLHEQEKAKRIARLNSGVYGAVGKPVLGPPGFYELPGYAKSVRTASLIKHASRTSNRQRARQPDPISLNLDMRCFFTGVECTTTTEIDRDPRKLPWVGTRDHLVPLRRDIPGQAIVAKGSHPIVWASNVANVTFGLAPLLIRLKIRQWLATAGFDRSDTSVDSGLNVRWLIIHYLDFFRIESRYPWSRKENGQFWTPEFSEPFMKKMFAVEAEFLEMDSDAREKFIKDFDWQF